MKLPLRYYGDPILRKHCDAVVEVNDEIRSFIDDLVETMDFHPASGLSAPQVGRSLRIFALRDYLIDEIGKSWRQSEEVKIFINPQITIVSKEEEDEVAEGCLSLPDMRVKVWRPLQIRLKALDYHGNPFEEFVEGYNARIRLHENDHLNGVLTIDRADPKTRRMLEPHLRAIKKKYNPK